VVTGRVYTIPRVGEVLDLGKVPVQNSSEAVYAVDSTGRRWVRKRVSEMGHEALLAEALGWLLSRHLSVPTPDAALSGEGAAASWLSSALPLVKHWSETERDRVRNIRAIGRVLALDAVLMNGDRHAGNILLSPLKKGGRMTAWAIDFDHALVGWPGDYAAVSVDELPSLRNLARGLPVAYMRPGARQAAREARLLDGGILARYVAEACEIAGEPSGDALLTALQARLDRAIELTDRYLAAIEILP
jgi:hypothetical protein